LYRPLSALSLSSRPREQERDGGRLKDFDAWRGRRGLPGPAYAHTDGGTRLFVDVLIVVVVDVVRDGVRAAERGESRLGPAVRLMKG